LKQILANDSMTTFLK